MKNWMFLWFTFLFVTKQLVAQEHIMPAPQAPLQIAVIAPLYLDSLFQNGELKYDKSLPAFSKAGLEFVQGVEIAFDTLNAGKKVEITFFDSKSKIRPVSRMIQTGALKKFGLIIGSIRPPEFTQLSDFARDHKIPLISATYPNDDGIVNNPYLVIVNSTLRAHIESIFSLLIQKHSLDNIYLIKQNGDDRIDNYFKVLNTSEGNQLIKINRIALDSFTTPQLQRLIDTTKRAVIIGAGLQENFATSLAAALYPIQKSNPVVLIGMPNWDEFPDFRKNTFEDFPVHFTAPAYNTQENPFLKFLENRYFDKYRTKPSDIAQSGFETAWFFTTLFLRHGQNFLDHLREPRINRYFEYNFVEVNKTANDGVADYFENKHLYFLKITNGKVTRN